MDTVEKILKSAKKTTRSRSKQKVVHESSSVVGAKHEAGVKSPLSAEKIEDKISSVIIIAICLFFLAFVTYQSSILNKNQEPQRSQSTFSQAQTNYDCNKHSGDYTGCVNAQVSGKGCSWYSDCKACIKGTHDGRTYEQICGDTQK